ncbi:tail fiber domain-containing protein [Vibrio hepatarius]|uniref:tail fiber domain-containing protein n=1 Tax=Vibrio hepatarius TaxID=171383 RepID=UPI001C0976BB|nr:tail fiber domain-containing protein [Vibrio hepatarius]MBU2896650.1 tail fiber domain-containing protein [Vibrio hepatarius]
MKQHGLLLYLGLLLFSLPSLAKEFNIFCYDQQQDDWEWSDNKQTFNWPLKTQEQPWENSYFVFIPISESVYHSLDGFCPEGTVPQPAEGHFSTWKVFYVTDGERSYFAPGKRSYHNLIDHVFLRFSDVHLKENIERITSTLEAVRTINGYRYNYISQQGNTELGFVAQEVEQWYPELINTHPESGYLQVDYKGMIAVLLESIKEMDERLTSLESQQP